MSISTERKVVVPKDRLGELERRLSAANAKLDDITAAKRKMALPAADGDGKARKKFEALEIEAVSQRNEIEIITLAIEAVEQEQADMACQIEEERQAEATKQRKAILDLREAEARESIQANIERFERTGQPQQAAIWREQLATLRQRLEAGAA